MAFTGTTGGGKKEYFSGQYHFAGMLPGLLLWDNTKDFISNNLAILKLMLLDLDEASLLFLSLKGQCIPQSCSDCKGI